MRTAEEGVSGEEEGALRTPCYWSLPAEGGAIAERLCPLLEEIPGMWDGVSGKAARALRDLRGLRALRGLRDLRGLRAL